MTSESDIIDLKARSREGRGLSQHSGDHWIEIQKNTFMNWVNLQLQKSSLSVTDFEKDFDDGIRLCALVESLQNRKIGRVIKKPINQHQCLENVTLALRAIAEDNIKLVNIGSEDIVNGSLKLILGLVWHLILRYQIGKTKFPPKKLMIAWLQAVIPECGINNFTSDWNDGVALHALIEYCKPGLCPNWRQLSRSNRLNNCQNAMTLARDELNIPIVVRPEDFSSPHLDELSGMTYLSYYMMVDSPGYFATRREIRALLQQQANIDNFTTDWNDGRLLCTLVKCVGGDVAGWPHLSRDHEQNLQAGIDGARRLGIEPIFSAKEMADPEVEHLGIMAYAAYFRQLKPTKIVRNSATMDAHFEDVYVKQERHFTIHAEDGTSHDAIRAEVIGPDSIVPVRTKWNGNRGDCYFTPIETGQHKLNVYCDGQPLPGCPVHFKAQPDKSKIKLDHPDRAVVGVTTELKVDMSSSGQGDLRLEAVSPSGRVMDMPVIYRDGVHHANFTPTEVGDWRLSYLYEGEHLNGSPHTVKVFDPSLVRITDLHSGTVGRELSFHADASKAGEGDVTCQVFHGDQKVHSYISEDVHGKYKVEFTPKGPGAYIVHAYMNNIEVRGSPYTVDIVDSSRVSVTGDGLNLVPVNTPATFTVNTNGAGGGKIDVTITGPNGENVHHSMSDHNGDKIVKYTPKDVGDYTIHVRYGDHEVSGSPFVARAFNTGAIIVTPLHDGFVNQPMYFNIDVGEAGEGQLQIMVNNGNIPNEVETERPGHYRIKFIPAEPGRQQVDILFNDIALPCSPLTCYAQDLSAQVVGLNHLIPVQAASSFHVQSQAHMDTVKTEVIVTGPSGQLVPARLVPTADGRGFMVEYTPREIGTHTIRASLAGQPIKGSPFTVRTFDPSQIRITKIKQGIVGVPCKFNVDASEAGDGTLEISVSHNGQNIPNNALSVGKNRYECSFIGQQAGTYKVAVTYNDVYVQGSPFTVNIIDVDGIKLTGNNWNLVACNSKSGFNLVSPHGSFEDMSVRIIDPEGSSVPCRLQERNDGTAKVEWHPSSIGTHKVYIEYAGVPIQGSPFTIKVFDSSRVRVSNISSGFVNRPVTFTMNASEAGDGNLEILVMCGDEIVPNYVQDEGNTMFRVTFTPRRAGLHLIHTQFNGEPVRGSPHECNILDPDNVQVTGKGVEMATANVPTSFHVDMKNAGDAKLNVRVVSPFGEEIPVNVSGNAKSGLRVDYTPYEVGVYKVYVDCAGIPVKGSPFSCNVFDPSHIRINAPGRAYFGKPVHFHVDTSTAGHGTLNFLVKSRGSEVPVRLRESASERFDVSFTPQHVSPHIVHVFFNDLPVPGTPFEVPVIDSSSVSVADDSLRFAKVYKETGLNLEHQGLDERDMDIRIISPSGNIIPARLSNHGNNLRINFTPLEVGVHKVHVNVGETPVLGSPFICNVFDPSAVRIIEVDKSPKKEREIGFTIDSASAGAGTLEVQITHKGQPVHAECRKIGEGRYHYTFKPLNVGRYEVKATFNGNIIPGSPLTIEVEEDAPTFIRINFSSVEPINTKGRNYFLLHTSGHHVDQDMLNVLILGCI